MTIHNNPRPQYFYRNINGDAVPAVGGTLYFGLPFQNPILFPIDIFSDSALDVQINSAQLLDADGRTITPVYPAGDYSLRFDDPNNVTVFEVTFVPAGGSGEGTAAGSLSNKILNGGMTYNNGFLPSSINIVNDVWTDIPVDRFLHKGTNITAGTVGKVITSAFKSGFAIRYNNVDSGANGRLVTKYQLLAEDIAEWSSSLVSIGCSVRHNRSNFVNYRIQVFSADSFNDFSSVTVVVRKNSDKLKSYSKVTQLILEDFLLLNYCLKILLTKLDVLDWPWMARELREELKYGLRRILHLLMMKSFLKAG